MGVDIDKLNIEVSTNAGKVAKEIDKVSKAMEKLKQSLENTGLPRLCNQLKKLKETAQELSGLNAYTEKVAKFSESIHKLSGLKIPSVSKMTARVKELVDMSKEMSSFTGADELAEKVNQICSAVKPMENMGKNTLAPFISSMKKIPELTKSMDTKAMQDFKNMIKEITSAIQPLTTQVSKSEKGLVSLNRIIQSTVSSNGNLAASNAAAVKSYTSVSSILTSTKAKLLAYSYAVIRVTRVLKDWLDLSNDYIENLNLFEVAMGKGAKQALNYAESVNKALGIDLSDWIRNQGVFKQVTSGFGILDDKSNIMSKNLTQLGYDISSFFNIDVDESMQKLQSGISGEIEPLRRLGYALDQTTLQQIAYSNGITMNINKMTQAQKSQLRYIAILQQSKNVTGDMARTVTTPANAMRILDQQINQLKRSIGNIISIVVQKLLPYIQAFVRLLGDAADYLAKLWGFELPTIDYSNVGNGLSNISDEADNATDSVKKTAKEMQRLAGFDELNILSSNDNSNSDNSNISNGFDLGLELPEYDFLGEMDKQTDSIYKNMKKKLLELINWIKENKRLVELLGIAIGVAFAVKKIKDFFKKLGGLSILKTAKTWVKNFIDGFKSQKGVTFFKKLKNGVQGFRDGLTKTQKILGTVAGIAMSSYGSYNLFKNLAKDTANWKTVLGDSALIVGGLGMSWIFGGLPGLAIGGLITAFAGLYGYIKGCDEEQEKLEKAFMESRLYGNGGTKISEIAGAFSDMKEDLDGSIKPLQDLQTEIDNTNKKISEDQFFVDTYLSKLQKNEPLTKTEIEKMQGHFNSLIENMKTNMELNTDLIYENFHNSAVDAAKQLGLDVDEMEKILDGFKEKYNVELDSVQKEQNNLFKKMTEGGGLSEAEKKKFNDNLQYITELNHNISDSEYAFQSAINSIGNIDFENENSAKEAIKKIKDSTEGMIAEIDNVNEDALKALADVKYKAKVMYEHEAISKEYYNSLCNVFSDMESSINQAYSDKKDKILNQYGAVMSSIELELEKYIDEFLAENGPNAGDKVKTIFKNGASYLQQFSLTGVLTDYDTSTTALDEAKSRLSQKYSELFKTSDELLFEYGKKSNETAGKEFLSNLNRYGVDCALAVAGGFSSEMEKQLYFLKEQASRIPSEFSEAVKKSGGIPSLAAVYSVNPNLNNTGSSYSGSSSSILYVPGYASGGFPTSGQLFYARENGIPEMVGKIGNQTAVANNNQIEKGIADAVFKAVTSANGSSVASNNQPINITVPVYIDGQKMDEQQYNYRQRQLVRSNGRREY